MIIIPTYRDYDTKWSNSMELIFISEFVVSFNPQKFERKEKIEQMYREKERQRVEITQRKWSKREEQEFYRTVSTYGVEFDR